jgi:hypothetical protein
VRILLLFTLLLVACSEKESVVAKDQPADSPASKAASPAPKSEPGPGAPEVIKGSDRVQRLSSIKAEDVFGANGPTPRTEAKGYVTDYMKNVLGDGRIIQTGAARCPMSKDEACVKVVACKPEDCSEARFEADFYVGDRGPRRLVVGSITRGKGASPEVVRSASDVDAVYAK